MKDFHGKLVIPSMGRHIHVSRGTPRVTGSSVVQEGNVFRSRRYNTSTDASWCEATRVKVEGSILTVTISKK
jgi:hypothetical protein